MRCVRAMQGLVNSKTKLCLTLTVRGSHDLVEPSERLWRTVSPQLGNIGLKAILLDGGAVDVRRDTNVKGCALTSRFCTTRRRSCGPSSRLGGR